MSDQAAQLRGMVEALRAGDAGPRERAVSIVPESVPTGMLSYGPAARRVERATRAAASAASNEMASNGGLESHAGASLRPARIARAIAVSSGKGGVGKSNIAVNLAVEFARRGQKVCLLDADLGTANADLLCNLQPRVTLEHVVAGKCRLAEAMVLAPGGFRLIPGASGVSRIADLAAGHRRALLEQFAALEQIADMLIIDCGAGISANVVGFAAAAQTVLVTTTPEPTAITDGYGMIKSLFAHAPDASVHVVVNMVAGETEGQNVFNRIHRVTQTFLKREIAYAGMLPIDPAVPAAVRQRLPFTLLAPASPASLAISRLGDALLRRPTEPTGEEDSRRSQGFFSRIAIWLGLADSLDAAG